MNNTHYDLIAEALYWLVENKDEQPDLQSLSDHIGLSSAHLQRTFQKWAGVSPKQFLKHLTKEAALSRLMAGQSVLDASYGSGLSGPGRLHDLLVTTEAVTPGEARARGRGMTINYGFGPSPFGQALLAWTQRGINFLGFCVEKNDQQVLASFKKQWSGATLVSNNDEAVIKLNEIFNPTEGKPLQLSLKGSPFQLKVWEALLAIPEGAHVSYGQLAQHIGQPGASQAVGSAVGSNPVAWLIPCHRVIRQLGGMGGYRWGIPTKQAMLAYEGVRTVDSRIA